MLNTKDKWNTPKPLLTKKNNPFDPLTWASGPSKREKNWYNLRVKSCGQGALRQPEQVCFILARVLKTLERKLFKGEEE